MNTDNGILIIISGPSGSGKGTIVERLAEEPEYKLSISATTRPPRPYEIAGVHYFFKTVSEFEKMLLKGELLEHATFCDHFYGTPKAYVEEMIKTGNNVILEIEVQGALQVKKVYPDSVLIFTMPPTISELRRRLTTRGTEDAATIEKRISRAMDELELLPSYDYIVINDELSEALSDIKTIVTAERMQCRRNIHLRDKFKGEMQ